MRPIIKIPFYSIRNVYRASLISSLPYSLSLALLYILIEPKTKPTLADFTDWMALCLFILGSLLVCALHSCIVYQMMYVTTQQDGGRGASILTVVSMGFKKMFPVFLMTLCYTLLVGLGLAAFVIPGIFLSIVGSLSLFIVVLKDTNPKKAFIESYRLLAPHWLSVAATMLILLISLSVIELIFDWIFTGQVVLYTLFSIILRGLLWPIVYATMLCFYNEFSVEQSIEDSQDSIPSRRNRKQKFLHTAPNQ